MNGRGTFNDGKVYVPVLSFSEGCGETLFESLGLNPAAVGEIPHGDKVAQVELFSFAGETHDELGPIIDRADACLLLVRHLDQLSMNRVKDVFTHVGAESFLPKSIAIYREPKETEFKISCTYCGQKLWVRDRDAGRRGNCPRCRKTFFIPTQKAYLTSFLMLTEAVPVLNVTTGDASFPQAVTGLVDRIASMDEGVKSSTIRIELPPE